MHGVCCLLQLSASSSCAVLLAKGLIITVVIANHIEDSIENVLLWPVVELWCVCVCVCVSNKQDVCRSDV